MFLLNLLSFALLSSTAYSLPAVAPTDSKWVPGDSQAYYIGDPSKEILSISSLELIQNPTIGTPSVSLSGNLSTTLSASAIVKLSISLNDIPGPTFSTPLCDDNKLEIKQSERSVCPPVKGEVNIRYDAGISPRWLIKGSYGIRVEVLAGKGSGNRVTGFEGNIYIEGAKEEGGNDWWPGSEEVMAEL